MSEPPVKPRRYRSDLREERARQTRQSIRRAASELFTRDGYPATSVKAIADRAGVSERTIFLAFPTKGALLAECITVAVRGDDDSAPMLARSAWRTVLDAPPERMVIEFARVCADLMSRSARLLAVGESIGPEDDVLTAMRERGRAATRADLTIVARAMKRAGVVRAGISAQRAAEVMYGLAASECVYLRLVDHCGWTDTAYAQMIERALAGALARGAMQRSAHPAP
jgi:AcrR family transcriptional regulator